MVVSVLKFFFFQDELHNNSVVKKAFDTILGESLRQEYYYSMEKFFESKITRVKYKKMLSERNTPVSMLYQNKYPEIENAQEVFEEFERQLDENYELSKDDAEAIIYWIYHVYKTVTVRRDITRKALSLLIEMLEIENICFTHNVLYLQDSVDINIINSISDFSEEMEWLNENEFTFFYRGHASLSYKLLPSIMRRQQWIVHENDMYNELKIACADNFSKCRTHLDFLVEMQHYGLPTRLLDVTTNPLVALYFACSSEPDSNGEIIVFAVKNEDIKYSSSDKVSMLASLPSLSYKENKKINRLLSDKTITKKEFNDKALCLLNEVKLEKPAFLDNMNSSDLSKAIFVLPEKKNQRIRKQDGCFLICGLFEERNNPIPKFRYLDEDKIQIYLIPSKAKKKIIQELDKFSVNRATLFPEIEEVANYIRENYFE